MAPKANREPPEPLKLFDGSSKDQDGHDLIKKSPLSPVSPISPRSPFKFISKKQQSGQSTPTQPAGTGANPSQLSATSLALLQDSESQEKERSQRTGFFSKHKASKGASRVQQSAGTDTVNTSGSEVMSKDAMSGKVSAKENSRNGKTLNVSCLLIHLAHFLTLRSCDRYDRSKPDRKTSWIVLKVRCFCRIFRIFPTNNYKSEHHSKNQTKSIQPFVANTIHQR